MAACAIAAATLRDFLRNPAAVVPASAIGHALARVLPRGLADPGYENVLVIENPAERDAAIARMSMKDRELSHQSRILGRPDPFGQPARPSLFTLEHVVGAMTHPMNEFGQVAMFGEVDPMPVQEGDPPPPPCLVIDTSTALGKIKSVLAPVWLFVAYMIPKVTILRITAWHIVAVAVTILMTKRCRTKPIPVAGVLIGSAVAAIPLLAIRDFAANIWWGFEQHHLNAAPPHYAVSLGPFGDAGITLAIIMLHATIVALMLGLRPPERHRWLTISAVFVLLLALFSWPIVTAWINRIAGSAILPY